MSIVENGNKCLELIFFDTSENNNNNNNEYDIIILNSHLPDFSGLVARKIRDTLPHKRIILTTT